MGLSPLQIFQQREIILKSDLYLLFTFQFISCPSRDSEVSNEQQFISMRMQLNTMAKIIHDTVIKLLLFDLGIGQLKWPHISCFYGTCPELSITILIVSSNFPSHLDFGCLNTPAFSSMISIRSVLPNRHEPRHARMQASQEPASSQSSPPTRFWVIFQSRCQHNLTTLKRGSSGLSIIVRTFWKSEKWT